MTMSLSIIAIFHAWNEKGGRWTQIRWTAAVHCTALHFISLHCTACSRVDSYFDGFPSLPYPYYLYVIYMFVCFHLSKLIRSRDNCEIQVEIREIVTILKNKQ